MSLELPNLDFSIPTSGASEQRALFDHFAEYGYSGLQLKGGQYMRYLEDPERFLADWKASTRLSLIFWGPLDDPGIARLRLALQFAGAIGAKMVVFCHAHSRSGVTEADIASFARTISDLGAESAKSGVKLSVHNHYDQPVMHREDIATFFDAATPGAVGLTVDTAHLVKSGVADIAGVLREFRGVVDNIHLKDLAGGEFRSLGQGEIPFGPIFAAMKEIDYRGMLCADEESGASVVEGMAVASRFIRAHWDAV
ncbi:MAG TPA: sugar phosphate isomerase/epimerase [Capsulimonadaceae bacterium]|nr:sugar phosphate isomerase/epimerase [Capsulimonadaceae bacterium]